MSNGALQLSPEEATVKLLHAEQERITVQQKRSESFTVATQLYFTSSCGLCAYSRSSLDLSLLPWLLNH